MGKKSTTCERKLTDLETVTAPINWLETKAHNSQIKFRESGYVSF